MNIIESKIYKGALCRVRMSVDTDSEVCKRLAQTGCLCIVREVYGDMVRIEAVPRYSDRLIFVVANITELEFIQPIITENTLLDTMQKYAVRYVLGVSSTGESPDSDRLQSLFREYVSQRTITED
ncbi:MAG: hypothetical protein NC120_06285 [Ruminococcus sp.]|nr:hypothetical protein [Ruminococcus sp.]